jgi:hypothetical protein
MARRATRNIHRATQVVFMRQILPQLHLVGVAFPIHLDGQSGCWLLVTHIKNLLAGPQIFFRPAMTLNTPLHLQRCVIKHQRHAIHRAVAGIASHALINVNAVIEINKVGKIIHPIPDQRFAGAIAFAHRFKQWRRRPDLRVAVHASLGRRNPREARSFNRSVAVAAIDTQRGHVVFVAERRWLRPRYPRIRDVGRALKIHASPKRKGKREDPHINRGPGNYVSAAMENLHRSGFFLTAESSMRPES